MFSKDKASIPPSSTTAFATVHPDHDIIATLQWLDSQGKRPYTEPAGTLEPLNTSQSEGIKHHLRYSPKLIKAQEKEKDERSVTSKEEHKGQEILLWSFGENTICHRCNTYI